MMWNSSGETAHHSFIINELWTTDKSNVSKPFWTPIVHEINFIKRGYFMIFQLFTHTSIFFLLTFSFQVVLEIKENHTKERNVKPVWTLKTNHNVASHFQLYFGHLTCNTFYQMEKLNLCSYKSAKHQYNNHRLIMLQGFFSSTN